MHSRPGWAVRRIALALCIIALLALLPAAASAARHHRRQATLATRSPSPPRSAPAARRSNRADRRLVTQARALRRCLRSGASCKHLRKNVQRAGRSFTAAQRTLACACATPAATTAP